ncbi:MAG TPA: SRPBCC domain-containing protein [Actinomycetota bacterium]|nr:SRPBCC domain-containing protein [Actinomycetota bacterium]
MSERLQLTRVLRASRAAVYRAWVDPAILSQWFAPGPLSAVVAELDATEGGRFRIEMHAPDRVHVAVGTFRELAPGERLVFSWAWEGWALPETTVRVELRALGDAETELTLTHEGFPDAAVRDVHADGWGRMLDRVPHTLPV